MSQHFRNEDPSTSRQAAESLDLSLKKMHYEILKHHFYHQDSDSNAGFVAFEKKLTKSPETGRRASRTLREAHALIEYRTDPQTKSPAVVQSRLSNRLGQRNFLTDKGTEALEKYMQDSA